MEHHFVTSTGTEIGKTIASTLLVRSLLEDHGTVGYWKPVASGCAESPYGYRSPDEVEVLERTRLEEEDVHSTYRFGAPLSPDRAALREDRSIHPETLESDWENLRDRYEALVVEGIGGIAVPFTENYDVADLIAHLGIPVLVVVASRLGTISHTRTALHYLRSHGPDGDGILLTPGDGEPIETTNRDHLREFFPDHFVDLLPRLDPENGTVPDVIHRYRSATNREDAP